MKLLLIVLSFVFSFAFELKIVKVVHNKVFFNESIKKGISGIVLCPYMNTEIICARAISFGDYAKLYPYSELKNDAFALPLVYPKSGDKVVFANDYERVLIIAPNQQEYLKAKNIYKNRVFVSPDILYSMYDDFNRKNFIEFANIMDIGLYVFMLKNKIYEVDAKSFYVINKKPFKGSEYKRAFFTYARGFDIKPINYIKWFKGLK